MAGRTGPCLKRVNKYVILANVLVDQIPPADLYNVYHGVHCNSSHAQRRMLLYPEPMIIDVSRYHGLAIAMISTDSKESCKFILPYAKYITSDHIAGHNSQAT